MFDQVEVLYEEIRCLSLLGLKGLTINLFLLSKRCVKLFSLTFFLKCLSKFNLILTFFFRKVQDPKH